MRRTPVTGPSVWTGSDIAQRDDWLTRLSPSASAQIVAAVKATEAAGIPLFEIRKEDFPVPDLEPMLAGLRDELEGGRGFAVLRGLQIGQLEPESAKRVIWGLAMHLGTPEPQDIRQNLLHSVTNTGKRVDGSDTTRGYETDDELKFHNDGGDAFMLLCLRTAQSGGVSKLVSVGALFNAILAVRPDLAEVLQQPFHFDSRAQNANEAKVQVVPILTEHEGHLNALYKRRYIKLAQRFDDVPRLTAQQEEALELFDRMCADPQLHLAFSMEPGDIQIGNNYSILHSRTRYTDHDDPAQRRHLYRVWLTLANGRPLPDIYADTREFGPSYARRLQRRGLPPPLPHEHA